MVYSSAMNDMLTVTIEKKPQFFSLFSDGPEDTVVYSQTAALVIYPPECVLFLYYTYPTHRRVYCVRNRNTSSSVNLPGLSEKVEVLFKQYASRVDKTKKAVSFIKAHHRDRMQMLSNLFYYRLDILLLKKGKLDYQELAALVQMEVR